MRRLPEPLRRLLCFLELEGDGISGYEHDWERIVKGVFSFKHSVQFIHLRGWALVYKRKFAFDIVMIYCIIIVGTLMMHVV